MAKGGSQSTTQETTFKPSPEQREIIQLALPWLRQYATSPPSPPSGTSIAGFNPTQTAAQQGLLDAIPGMAQFASGVGEGNRFLFSGDVLDPNTNPGLQGAIDAATRPITEAATEQLLPNIRGDAVLSGQYGGSKQGQVEQQLAQDTLRQVGDTASNITSGTYTANLEAMTRGLALAPQTMQSMLSPALTQSAVGDVRHAMEQAQMSEAFNLEQLAGQWPILIAQQLLGAQAQIPGGTNVSTGETSGGGGGGLGSILGGVASMIPSLFAFL